MNDEKHEDQRTTVQMHQRAQDQGSSHQLYAVRAFTDPVESFKGVSTTEGS